MATNSPEASTHLKSPRSPRQLPQLPQIPISGQRSPNQLSVTNTPSTPLVFKFPAEYYPETPNTNFDFDDGFTRVTDSDKGGSSRSPTYYSLNKNPKSSNSSDTALQSSNKKSPVFQFCDIRKSLGKTMSYPPKSTISSSNNNTMKDNHGSISSFNFTPKSPKMFDRRRNSSFGLGGLNSPISPTIVAPTSSSSHCGPKHSDSELRSPKEGNFAIQDENVDRNCSVNEKIRASKMGGYLNRSQGCLNDATRNREGNSLNNKRNNKNEKNMARRSTSDLTEIGDAETEVTLLSSPRRRGSMKGGLAYLASRRGSRDSQCSNVSNISNEDVGPLNFNAHPRGRRRRTSNFLELPVPDHIRPRVHSLPEKVYNPRACDDLYTLREFSITHKGVVNRGDSIISRGSKSNTSVNSSRNSNVSGERSPFEGSCCSGQGGESSESEIEEIPKYRVVLLGDSGVGKTALVSQFMTSEYMNTYDASLDDEFGEKTVSILLDEEESELIFIDHPHIEMSVENSLSTYEPHACIVVYSIVSRTSFQMADEILSYLWTEHYTQERSVIVVGNKSDLARSRTIAFNEGKQLAMSRECKFIETSSGIKHNVDELLVGVLKQIRLRESRDKKLRRQCSKGKMSKLHGSKTAYSLNLAREILNKMCLNDSKSKSCENLHVL